MKRIFTKILLVNIIFMSLCSFLPNISEIKAIPYNYIGKDIDFTNFNPLNNSVIDTSVFNVTWDYWNETSIGEGGYIEFSVYYLNYTVKNKYTQVVIYSESYANIIDLPQYLTVNFTVLHVTFESEAKFIFTITYYRCPEEDPNANYSCPPSETVIVNVTTYYTLKYGTVVIYDAFSTIIPYEYIVLIAILSLGFSIWFYTYYHSKNKEVEYIEGFKVEEREQYIDIKE
ncbi:MAG: hypothetical protein WC934_02825 [Acidithiobacillus sp.]|jgi:hypothetical protein|uniref:hypothetical protein n=1 Tax=Acidithiobacillus sp. TaxID=1872118 RepID=UPI00355F6882